MDEFELEKQSDKNLRDEVAKLALLGLLTGGSAVYYEESVDGVVAKAIEIADAWMAQRANTSKI